MEQLEGREKRAKWMIPVLGVLLAAAFVLSFGLGRLAVPPGEVVRILLHRVFPDLAVTWEPNMEAAVINVRMPRLLMACLVGCGLAAAGAAYQGVFQNPMASPDILGASNGACFGAALAIYFDASNEMTILSAFVVSILTVALVYVIGERAPGKKVVNLVLAGIMVSSLFSAGTSFIKLVADPNNQLPEITYWLMGSLSGVQWDNLRFAVVPVAVSLVPLLLLRWRMNVLTLGDDEARTMGVSARTLRLTVVVCASLATAACISATGMIGWVGLVIPHLCRKLVGCDFRRLMPCSMLAGALFLLCVDDISRNLLATEIPIGILTAFVGAPFFIYLIMEKER